MRPGAGNISVSLNIEATVCSKNSLSHSGVEVGESILCVYMCVCVYLCVHVCLCVKEKEGESVCERERERVGGEDILAEVQKHN
jgi:hypothetical protein